MLTTLIALAGVAFAGTQLDVKVVGPDDSVVLEETVSLPYEHTQEVQIDGVSYVVEVSAEQDGNAVKLDAFVSYMKKGKKKTALCHPALSLTPDRNDRTKKPTIIPKDYVVPEGEAEPPVLFWHLQGLFTMEADEADRAEHSEHQEQMEAAEEAAQEAAEPTEGAGEADRAEPAGDGAE